MFGCPSPVSTEKRKADLLLLSKIDIMSSCTSHFLLLAEAGKRDGSQPVEMLANSATLPKNEISLNEETLFSSLEEIFSSWNPGPLRF